MERTHAGFTLIEALVAMAIVAIGLGIAVPAYSNAAAATHAGSPSGLNGPGIDGYTTPHDLALIFRAAMANPVFAAITGARSAPFPGDAGPATLVNQNEMLFRYPGMRPSIPIQLTAVAATVDMRIRTFMLGEGRIVPSNFRSVEPNAVRLSWPSLLRCARSSRPRAAPR